MENLVEKKSELNLKAMTNEELAETNGGEFMALAVAFFMGMVIGMLIADPKT